MKTSMSWMRTYVNGLSCTPQEYADKMTLTGTKCEGFVLPDKNLEKIVVGKINIIKKHPDADRLIVCMVDCGPEYGTVQIVTGADNVNEGDLVPVVLEGGRVAGGHDGGPLPENGIKIKKGKLRGVESHGMLCSIEELGCDRNLFPDAPEDGIYILNGRECSPGDDAIELLGLHEAIFEFEITNNRVDCYSQLGIARETAATFCLDFIPPKVPESGNSEKASDYIDVEIRHPEICSRYIARVVKNVRIAPSPEWMRRRLAACGIRPINNIVDITNYVMEEYGQPMHAFDYDTIEGHKIIVRRANDGDIFRTLDGQDRTLDSGIAMICDAKKEIGIGGIMGGENSKITDDVKTMVFESACFNGTNIRLSTKRLGLKTDASSRFDKGLDPNNCQAAIDRACALIEELGAGEVVGGQVDVYPEKLTEGRVSFDPAAINALLGTDIPKEEMLSYFKRLELKYDEAKGQVIVPTFRRDIKCGADLAEEVARFYGYDRIPATLPPGEVLSGSRPFKMEIEIVARQSARFCGFSQAMSYSFESPKVFDRLRLAKDAPERVAVPIKNPLGEDFSILRTIPLNGILQSLAQNYNRRNKDVRLFEFANIYIPKGLPVTDLPDERMQFVLGFYGNGDFYDMKGAVEVFLNGVGLSKNIKWDPDCDRPFLHPGRRADIICGGRLVGYIGEVHILTARDYGINDRVYVAVIDLPQVASMASFARKFTGVAKHPAISRDLSLVVPENVNAWQIEDVITKNCGAIMESVTLFDIYEGDQIAEGFKSMAYNIVFRAKDRTLEDSEADAVIKRVLDALKDVGVKLRG